MKRLHLLLCIILAAMLASCSNDSFKVDGDITGLDVPSLRVIFNGDSGIVDLTVDLDKKGHFSFKSNAAQPVIVNLLDHHNKRLAAIVAVNGDHISVKGDATSPMSVKVKGSKVNDDWQLFRNEHAAYYTDPNPSRLCSAIEKYVREHPADILSTALLVADYTDYSDRIKVDKMIKSIQPQARPQSLIGPFRAIAHLETTNNYPRLMTLNLVKHGSDFEQIDLTGHTTLLVLWANPATGHTAASRQIAQALDQAPARFKVIDILAESDTLQWHTTIAADPADWQHYWAPGGPLEQGIQLLHINAIPWYAVTDSTGLITYSGPDLKAALRTAL